MMLKEKMNFKISQKLYRGEFVVVEALFVCSGQVLMVEFIMKIDVNMRTIVKKRRNKYNNIIYASCL